MTTSEKVYLGNKPTCEACGEPIEDADGREQRAGRIYHRDRPFCQKAYNATSGSQEPESAAEPDEAREEAADELELSDDDLARTAIQLGEESDRLAKMSNGALFELEGRLIERKATKFDGVDFSGVLRSTGYSHTIDDKNRLMDRLGPLLSLADQDRAFPLPKPAQRGVNHTILNDLHKLGGEVATIIDEERRSAERRPRLELKKKEGPDNAGSN